MAPQRAVTVALLSAGAALTVGGQLFAQPVSGPRIRPATPVTSLYQQTGATFSGESAAPLSSDGDALRSLLLGLTLGLAVAFTGATSAFAAEKAAAAKPVAAAAKPAAAAAKPAAAAAKPKAPAAAPVPANFDYRKTPDVKMARAWAKEKAKTWAVRQFAPEQDKKYSTTSTGAGRYKLYGLDQFSPVNSIPSTTNGTYPVRKAAPAKNERMIKAAQPFLNPDSKYGNFYSRSSPYPYNPQ